MNFLLFKLVLEKAEESEIKLQHPLDHRKSKSIPGKHLLLLQEGGPLPGPETGLLSTLRNELSEETHVLTKQEILLGRAPEWRAVG